MYRYVLGAYRIEIFYNSSFVEFGSTDVSGTILTGALTGTSVDATDTVFTGSNARVLLVGSFPRGGVQGTRARIARLRVRATVAGVHELTGTALLQSNDLPIVTFADGVAIDAGAVRFLATTSRSRREDMYEDMPVYAVGPRSPELLRPRRQETCSANDSQLVRGDVDCNCAFQPGDALYVHKYVAAAYVGFQVSYRSTIEDTVARCPHTVDALDADLSGIKDARDASLLLQILAQQTFFVDLDVTPVRNEGSCSVDATATVTTDTGDAVPTGVDVYFVVSSLSEVQVTPVSGGGGATITGTTLLVAASRATSGATFNATFSSEGSTTSIGVSILLVVSTSTVPRAFLYAGDVPDAPDAPSGTPFPELSMQVTPSGGGAAVAVTSFGGSSGYFARVMLPQCANLTNTTATSTPLTTSVATTASPSASPTSAPTVATTTTSSSPTSSPTDGVGVWAGFDIGDDLPGYNTVYSNCSTNVRIESNPPARLFLLSAFANGTARVTLDTGATTDIVLSNATDSAVLEVTPCPISLSSSPSVS